MATFTNAITVSGRFWATVPYSVFEPHERSLHNRAQAREFSACCIEHAELKEGAKQVDNALDDSDAAPARREGELIGARAGIGKHSCPGAIAVLLRHPDGREQGAELYRHESVRYHTARHGDIDVGGGIGETSCRAPDLQAISAIRRGRHRLDTEGCCAAAARRSD